MFNYKLRNLVRVDMEAPLAIDYASGVPGRYLLARTPAFLVIRALNTFGRFGDMHEVVNTRKTYTTPLCVCVCVCVCLCFFVCHNYADQDISKPAELLATCLIPHYTGAGRCTSTAAWRSNSPIRCRKSLGCIIEQKLTCCAEDRCHVRQQVLDAQDRQGLWDIDKHMLMSVHVHCKKARVHHARV
jgi:hypothetical protein